MRDLKADEEGTADFPVRAGRDFAKKEHLSLDSAVKDW